MTDVRQAAILATEAAIAAKTPEPAPVANEPVDPVIADSAPHAEIVSDDDEHFVEDSAPSDAGADPTARPRKKPGVHQRIAEITREKHEERREREAAQRERDYWREQAQQSQRPQPVPQTQATQGKPTLEAYNWDQEAYFEALADYKAEQRLQGYRAEQQQAEYQRSLQAQKRQFDERVAAFEKEMPGAWEEAARAPLTITQPMAEVIANSEKGPWIGHYLATHLDEAHAISQQSPYAQAAALGRIEASLTRAPAPSALPRNTVTRAPAPAPVVTSPSASGSSALRGIEDHIAAVRAQKRASR